MAEFEGWKLGRCFRDWVEGIGGRGAGNWGILGSRPDVLGKGGERYHSGVKVIRRQEKLCSVLHIQFLAFWEVHCLFLPSPLRMCPARPSVIWFPKQSDHKPSMTVQDSDFGNAVGILTSTTFPFT